MQIVKISVKKKNPRHIRNVIVRHTKQENGKKSFPAFMKKE